MSVGHCHLPLQPQMMIRVTTSMKIFMSRHCSTEAIYIIEISTIFGAWIDEFCIIKKIHLIDGCIFRFVQCHQSSITLMLQNIILMLTLISEFALKVFSIL